MRLAFDMAAFLWTCLLAGKDKEYGVEVTHDDKKVYVNSAQYGYDLAMNKMLQVMEQTRVTPHQCILVFEGMHSKKRRQAVEPSYKGNRDSRPPEAYIEYQKAIAMMERAWLDVGAISMRQPFVEGDDVLGYLAHHTEDDLTIATYDNDLSALSGTNPQGKQINVWVDGRVNENKYGDFAMKHITLYKSLVGDTNDNIKGCVGFGGKSWETFRTVFGDEGLDYLHNLLAAGSLGDLHLQRDEDKLIRMICDQEAQVMRSYQLAKIHYDWVNTRSHALEINAGMCKPETDATDGRLRKWSQHCTLVTTDNFDHIFAWAISEFDRSPFVALDIETSTPPESDEWLMAQTPANPDGVDVMGSRLTGLSLTFGSNLHQTVYVCVDHKDTRNVSSERVRQLVAAIPKGKANYKDTVIQNLNFELVVLYEEWHQQQLDNGYEGFLPGCLDTKMEASYVNENIKNGLKLRSLEHLKYKQSSYADTTQLSAPLLVTEEPNPDEGGPPIERYASTLRPGGRQVKVFTKVLTPKAYWHQGKQVTETEALALDEAGEVVEFDDEVLQKWETRQYKMNELTGEEVFGYGCDDTICTAGLHNFYKLVMELEHTWQCYLDTEIDAAYMSAVGFIQGTDFSPARMRELSKEDDATYEAAWAVVRDYLISKGWAGSICPVFNINSKPADFKLAYQIVTGRVLESQARLTDKLAKLMAAEGADVLAELLMACYKLPSTDPETGAMTRPWQTFNDYVKRHFKGEPDFNSGSPKQKQQLFYELLGLPIRIRNKPTDQMKAAGITEGSPKTDVLAIDWALKFDAKPEDKPVLQALKLMQMVETRRTLYYNKYNGLVHWKTGKLHSSLNQCQANTRRSSESDPNKQQLPKHPKIEGQPPKFREVIVPHHDNAVVVSLDESSQELRLIADYSKDPAMVACYVGDSKKDMHSLTGVGIAKWKYPDREWSYEAFEEARHDTAHILHKLAKECRVLGKKVNFTTEYGAMAKKVAETLIITEAEAQAFVDAKEAAFPVAAAWKNKVIEEARSLGYVCTKMGARRHLREALNSNDGYESSKAERQAVNFKVQSGSAEQTKRAYGAAWKRRLAFKYDAVFIGPIHDEVVWSVGLPDLLPFLQEMHECMTQPYADMTIPIESSISFGPNFGQQFEIGEQPTEAAVAAGLAAMRKAAEESKLEQALVR